LTRARTELGEAFMVDTPTSGPPAERRVAPLATARESRLAAALRANLRRRKAAPKAGAEAAPIEDD
jgi:hypothetical protein